MLVGRRNKWDAKTSQDGSSVKWLWFYNWDGSLVL